MAKYIEDQIHSSQKGQDPKNYEDLIFQTLKKKLFLFILSSVQIASKLDLYSNVCSAHKWQQNKYSMCYIVICSISIHLGG